jgi:hypothetical protein
MSNDVQRESGIEMNALISLGDFARVDEQMLGRVSASHSMTSQSLMADRYQGSETASQMRGGPR